MKPVGLREESRAAVPSLARNHIAGRWPKLPGPADDVPDDRDPLDAVAASGVRMAMVDRGNALLDAMGWRAAQVAVVDPAQSAHPLLSGLL